MKDGSVVCWGQNHFLESTPNSGDFVQVSCGNGSTCGLRPNGLVECWGKNDQGQSSPPANKIYKQISSSLNKHVCGESIAKMVQNFVILFSSTPLHSLITLLSDPNFHRLQELNTKRATSPAGDPIPESNLPLKKAPSSRFQRVPTALAP